jgi:hypothetical protein
VVVESRTECAVSRLAAVDLPTAEGVVSRPVAVESPTENADSRPARVDSPAWTVGTSASPTSTGSVESCA